MTCLVGAADDFRGGRVSLTQLDRSVQNVDGALLGVAFAEQDLARLRVANFGLLDERVQVVLLQAVDRRQSLELREFDLLGHRRARYLRDKSSSARESNMRAPVEVPTPSRLFAQPGPAVVRRETRPKFVC